MANTEGITVEKGFLVIRMPLQKGVLSKTGKSYIRASTGGFVEVPGTDVKVNLTAISKAA